jgi:hypothetical protein
LPQRPTPNDRTRPEPDSGFHRDHFHRDHSHRDHFHRDHAAFTLVIARAAQAGLFHHMRTMPPATVDRIAAASSWEVGPTRAALHALTACGLVRFDADLSTWSLVRDASQVEERLHGLLDLARALVAGAPTHDPACRVPAGILENRILAANPELQALFERGGLVVDLSRDETVRRWLNERHPEVRVMQLDRPPAVQRVDLVLQLSPLARPDEPELWLEQVARMLAPTGRLVLRALRRPLEPPAANGQGWWHALALVAALQGGSGRVWSEPDVLRGLRGLRGLRAARLQILSSAHWPEDPYCVYFIIRNNGSVDSIRPC